MQNIFDYDLKSLCSRFAELNIPKFRAKQVFLWLHKKLVFDFSLMSDLPLELREVLSQNFAIGLPRIIKTFKSKDKTIKFLFGLSDGTRIESVLLKSSDGRFTICVSTQVGCPLACAFCATGQSGFKRNLTASEIIGQVYLITKNFPGVTNIVYMGMGEPFLNYANVVKSINVLISKEGLNFGQRKISISTSGIPEKIRIFAAEDWQVRLAVSLNSADERIRSRLMPINKKIPLSRIKDAIKYYISRTGRRVTLEYIMIKDVNDTPDALVSLLDFCQGLLVNVNLIPFNSIGGSFKASEIKTVNLFLRTLINNKINVNLRNRRGEDIQAACGQLAFKPL
ncbi:MAG: 23S rRNA (adenine2503-C2)-methyltransferase [Candidatus Saganbacteria bacterium]|uniref:Probable dual-specificity RNA methyltransferase RlmN n=1 Tax=Candidatus Saganbacteria bacterium TaxID=2575572 RepID=A0A833L225_UNCSA|nr:MAG: 23S rRNA (adenine2503-C2)-methyltransferase [Candidatus Saganbacteria bacterium]